MACDRASAKDASSLTAPVDLEDDPKQAAKHVHRTFFVIIFGVAIGAALYSQYADRMSMSELSARREERRSRIGEMHTMETASDSDDDQISEVIGSARRRPSVSGLV